MSGVDDDLDVGPARCYSVVQRDDEEPEPNSIDGGGDLPPHPISSDEHNDLPKRASLLEAEDVEEAVAAARAMSVHGMEHPDLASSPTFAGVEGQLTQPEKDWKDRRKHIFIVSSSGKPVFSRYGDECSFSELFGMLQVMVCMVENKGENIRRVTAGNHQIVFLKQGELVYVMVAQTGEPYPSYVQQLKYLHHQIESIIPNVDAILKKKQGFDLRRFIGDADLVVVRGLIKAMNTDPAFYLESVHPVRAPRHVRLAISNAAHECCVGEDHVFTFVFHRRSVVQIVSFQKHSLHPADVLLLINHVNTSPSILHAETWVPLCLPRFSAGAFLWVYVDYLDRHLALVQIATTQELFESLSHARDRFRSMLEKSNTFSMLKDVESSIGDFPVVSVGVTELRHVMYVVAGQYVTSSWPIVATQNIKERKRMLRGYAHYRHLARNCSGKEKIALHLAHDECVMVQVTKDWELYMTFAPMTPKTVMVQATSRVRRYLKSIEEEIFLVQK
eukprot:PhF_6_TR3463/c0_g1_i2/m.5066/K20195/MON1; vacuolar fusion protein MON1